MNSKLMAQRVDGTAVAKSSSISGNSMTSTYLGRIDCTGTENTISECAQRSSICIKPGAGVICPVQNGKHFLILQRTFM